MSRRRVKDWKPERVEDAPVAPHRYKWDGVEVNGAKVTDLAPVTYDDWKKTVPYGPGEVVFVDFARLRDGRIRKARILSVFPERDRFGDRRELYMCQLETERGVWSKDISKVWPGMVQRGYKAAGLAPDVP